MDTRSFRGTGKLLVLLIICSALLVGSHGFSLGEDQAVTLQWAPSLSNGVVGYNLYRSQNAGSGYQKINTQLIAGTSFKDETLQPGIEYFYVCRAVTIEGVESSNSNEASYILEDLNTPPEVADDTIQTDEDTWVDISPLGNDYDADGDFLEIIALTQPQQGTAVLSSATEIRYTPDPDYNGLDTFTYTVTDPGGQEGTGSVSIQVIAVNDPPQAFDDVLVTDEDTAAEINLLGNDTDPDNEVLTLAILQNPANGSVEILSGGICRYVPSSNFSGTDLFTYRASDSSDSSTASVSVTVNPVNDSPVASDDSFTTNENTNGIINILVNDYDPEGDSLTLAIIAQPNAGSAVIQADGSILYTPQSGYSGSDSFTYSVTDSEGQYDSALVSINIAPAAVVFSAVADFLAVNEDSQITLNLLGNDQNPGNLSLTLELQSLPLYGQAQLSQDGILTYTPNADFYGSENLTYSLSDNEGNTSMASVSIEVSPVNDPPLAVGETASTAEDEPVTIELLLNDSDIDNDPLSASMRSAPQNGTVTVSPSGRAVFTPNKDFFGNDSFSYDVSDGTSKAAATVQISVSPVNDSPVAADDSLSTNKNTNGIINILVNDYDPEGDSLTPAILTQPSAGSAVIQADGSILYTPQTGYSGSDSFTYSVTDSGGLYDSASVSINIAPAAVELKAENDFLAVSEDSQITLNLLSNDQIPENITLTLELQSLPLNGQAQLSQNGLLTYTPNADFFGSENLTYSLSDNEGTTSIASVSIEVSPVNDPPLAVGETASTAEDEPVTVELLLNDSDIDNDPLSASLRSAPQNGTVTISPSGQAVFTPNKNFFGDDSFSYDVSDGLIKAAATVQISVSPVNDPPDSIDDSMLAGIRESAEINVLSNDSDPEGDAISAYLERAPEHGTVTIKADGQAVYTPTGDFSGADTFIYRAEDSYGESSSALVNVVVSGENRSPVAEEDNASVAKRSQVVFNVLTNDTDPDGDTLELVEISKPSNGTALIKSASGDIEYNPETWFRGTDSFTYIVSDGEAETTGVVNVSVISKPSVRRFSFPSSIEASRKILQDTYIGVGVVNTNKSEESVSFVGFDKNGTAREVIHLGSKLPPQGQLALMTSELGETDEAVEQLTVEGDSADIQGFFMVGDIKTDRLDGVGGVQIPSRNFYFPVARENDETSTLIYLINQDSGRTALISAALHDGSGKVIANREMELTPNGSASGSIRDLFGDETTVEHGYLRISSTTYVSGYEIVLSEKSIYAFSARSPKFSNRLYAPHFIAGEGNNSEISVLSTGAESVKGVITLMNDQGQTMVSSSITVDPSDRLRIDLNNMLSESEKYDTSAGLLTGSVLIELDESIDVLSTITMHTAENKAVTAMPLASEGLLDFVFPMVAQSADGTIFMGFSIMNPGNQTANARLSVFNDSGVLTAEKQITLPPLHRLTDLLSGDRIFGPGFSQMGGHIKLVSDRPLVSVSIYGDYRGRYLSTVDGQLGEVETAAAVAELERSLAEMAAEMAAAEVE